MTDPLIAAFLAKGGKITKVAEGHSQIERDKAAKKEKSAKARANREWAEQKREDRAMYADLCREAARD